MALPADNLIKNSQYVRRLPLSAADVLLTLIEGICGPCLTSFLPSFRVEWEFPNCAPLLPFI